MTLAATILLSMLPQVFPGSDLKLPPKQATAENPEEVRPLLEIERFRRDLLEMGGPAVKVEAKLEEMGRDYPKIESLILEVARTARATEMRNLMPVARRHGRVSGTSSVSDELLFQLLARRLGPATRRVVETMAVLKGPDAKLALQQCVRARIPAVRHQAVFVLGPMCNQDDVQFALGLSREQSLDLRLRGVDLLQAIGGDVAANRLVELLSKDPALAASACRALVRLRDGAVPALHKHVDGPPIDRSYVYSAFALAQIADKGGDSKTLPAKLLKPLIKLLRAPEALTRVLAAVPLADLAYRAAPAEGQELPDTELVDALLLVVEPKQFVPNLDLLRAPAESRLMRHTGRVISGDEALSWRNWWRAQRDSFLGVRSQLAVDAGNSGAVILTVRQPGRIVRVLGEDVASMSPLRDAIELLLPAEQMMELVRSLQSDGYGNAAAMRVESSLPLVRSLELRVAGGRSSVAVTEKPHLPFDTMVASIEACVDRELWQLYRMVGKEPDRAAYWRSEQTWRNEHPSEVDRARRFLGRVLLGWSTWGEELQARAIGFLAGHKQRKDILREQDGRAIVATIEKLAELRNFDLQMLEVAASAPGDKVWRDCVALAVSMEGGGRKAVTQVFRVLGPDAVLSALSDPRALVRRAAIDEVVSVRDQRAAPQLIQLLQDEDFDVQRAAVFACGHLKIPAASRPLVDLIASADPDPVIRRECLRALGNVGGQLAFPVLQQTMASPVAADKEAALRGLGQLRDPRAAHLLAEYAVLGYGKDLGDQAKFHLQRQGGTMAVPALQRRIPLVQDQKIRAELVLLLGMYQDPENIPELLDLLRQSSSAAQAATALEGATGIDLKSVPDRVAAAEAWWRKNQSLAQWQWLLNALEREGISSKLKPSYFRADQGMAAVPELSRLLVEVPDPTLWVLCSAVLRTVAGQDFGVVTAQTPPDLREGMAGRYRLLAESAAAKAKESQEPGRPTGSGK